MKINIKFDGRLEFDRIKTVRREAYCVGDRIINYGLFEFASPRASLFCLTVGDAEECEARIIDSRVDAKKLFFMIAEGGCAPCALDDVLADIYNIL